MTFGLWLRRRRKDQGLTLAQVAERASLSVSFLSELERDLASARVVSVRTVVQLSQGYGLAVTTIIRRIREDKIL